MYFGRELEKSIAVLPFINESPLIVINSFINGIMEEVLNNLQTIKDFRVLSRTSVEQFRNTTKSIPEIARELEVNYIVEGSGQKIGNNFRLRVQLIRAKGKEAHLWAKSYEQEILETKDIFKIQSQIAQAIAAELKAIITPEEKQLIEKVPTTSLTAYDFYQRGREELWTFGMGSIDRETVKRAEFLFKKALENDSTFALAYVGLGHVYWKKNSWEENYSKNLEDSMLFFANKALSYDDKLSEAYYLRGGYYWEKGNINMSEKEFDKAIKFNPNKWESYSGKSLLYRAIDLVKSIENLQEAASRNHSTTLPEMLRQIASLYYQAGFPEKSKDYNLKALDLDGDSVKYLDNLADVTAFAQGDFKKAIEHYEKRYFTDSMNVGILVRLGFFNSFIGQYKESLKYYKKYISRLKVSGYSNVQAERYLEIIMESHIGYAYMQNGYKKEAEFYFDKSIETYNNIIKSAVTESIVKKYCIYMVQGLYACRGDKSKAFENLKLLRHVQFIDSWQLMLIKKDPLFNSIKNEPEFQQIVRDVEVKYQAEHERVRKWLEENNML